MGRYQSLIELRHQQPRRTISQCKKPLMASSGIELVGMTLCAVIYAMLVIEMVIASNLHSTIFSITVYIMILCFSLFKTRDLAKSIFHTKTALFYKPICNASRNFMLMLLCAFCDSQSACPF